MSAAEHPPVPPPAAPPRPASADGAVHVGGRPRNTEIDRHVLEVALRHLRREGLAALSVAAVAEEAGTTRAAVYRRWAGRTELAVAALATIADRGPAPASGQRDALQRMFRAGACRNVPQPEALAQAIAGVLAAALR